VVAAAGPGTSIATGSLGNQRANHTATLLNNGRVLITGGSDTSNASLSSAELYDPATGLFTATGSLAGARQFHTATPLADGPGLGIPAGGVRCGMARHGAEGAEMMLSSPTAPDLASHFKHAEDVVLADTSHFIPMEAPERVAALIASWPPA